MAEKLTTCKTCEKEVAKSAKICPHCGGKLKMSIFKKFLIALGLLLAIAIFASQGQETKKASSNSPSLNKEITIRVPKLQEDFGNVVMSFYEEYRSAPNELKKSAVRKKRKQAIKEHFNEFAIKNWVGKLKALETTGEGKAYIAIKPSGTNFIIKTWNNELSDIGDQTLIDPEESLYATLSELSEGDLVQFSGTFISSDLDYIKEISVTEEGGMIDPEFLLKFSNVTKYSPPI